MSQFAGDDSEVLPSLSGFSEEALVEAAAEVGFPVAAMRRSLAVERLDPLPRRRAGDRIVGAAVVAVDAEVAGTASEVLAELDAWFVRPEDEKPVAVERGSRRATASSPLGTEHRARTSAQPGDGSAPNDAPMSCQGSVSATVLADQ